MSWETLVWAKAQRTGSVGAKAVLMALAEYADELHSCFPSQERIAFDTEQSVSTVYRHIRTLSAAGMLARVHRPGTGDGRKPDRYVLQVDGATGQIDELGEATGQNDGGNRSTVTDRTPERTPDSLSPPTPPSFPTAEAVRLRRSPYPAPFVAFWTAYPRRVAKHSAYKAWLARIADARKQHVTVERRVDAMVRAAVNYASECDDHHRSEEHIMHAATFLGPQDRWRDYAVARPVSERPDTGVPSWATGQRTTA